MTVNDVLKRDWVIIAPIGAIILGFFVYLPTTSNYIVFLFAICSGLIGMYGGVRGKGKTRTEVQNYKNGHNGQHPNPIKLPTGLVRLICGIFCAMVGLIMAAQGLTESSILLFFGMAGEFLGISLPGIVNYFQSPEA